MAEENKGVVIKAYGQEVDPDPEVVKGLEEFKVGEEVISAEEWVDRWYRHAKNAVKDYESGVKRPRKNPPKAAAESREKWKNKMKEVIEKDIWGKKMEKVTFEDWALGCLLKGIPRYGDGIEKGKIKAEARYKELRDLVLALKRALDKMPEGTPEERAAKMLAAREGMRLIGLYRKGVITKEELMSEFEKLTKMRVTITK